MSAALAMMRAMVPGLKIEDPEVFRLSVEETPSRPGYDWELGSGDSFQINVVCSEEQRHCIDNWFKGRDFPAFMNALMAEAKRRATGGTSGCGCGE